MTLCLSKPGNHPCLVLNVNDLLPIYEITNSTFGTAVGMLSPCGKTEAILDSFHGESHLGTREKQFLDTLKMMSWISNQIKNPLLF